VASQCCPPPGRPPASRLTENRVDHPLLDTGHIAAAVRELYPGGVDAALDLVGTPTLPDTLRAVRVHGTACFSGSLSNQWTVRDFAPNEYPPKGVRLAGYSGDAADLPRAALQEILDAIAAGQMSFPVDRVYDGLEQVRQAHDDLEHDRATGKLVVRVRH
jgi:NADPH:quinone reductase